MRRERPRRKHTIRRTTPDPNIITASHHPKQPTFFTRDKDFFSRELCHNAYCLVWLNVPRAESAQFIRAFLHQPGFRIRADLMGVTARAHSDAIHFWKGKGRELQEVEWLPGKPGLL